ncbi:MAG: alpha/beta hydrolase [Bryobacteraceae bacterium]|jgi:proline iminopeptidase
MTTRIVVGLLLIAAAQAQDESYWTVEKDIRLFHFSEGKGKNVLMVHGGPGFPTHTAWPGLKPLTSHYRFVYYDQRGCGRSTRPIDKFASLNYGENLKELIRTLGLRTQITDIEKIRQSLGDEKLILIGHSFGGFLAAMYASEHPEQVKALILVAPAEVLVMPAADGGLYERIKTLLPEAMKPEYGAFLGRYFDYGRIFTRSEADLKSINAEFGKYYRAAAEAKGFRMPPEEQIRDNGGWMVHAMFFSMGRQHDYRDALKKVSAPVLVIHGERDLQPEQASRLYADTFPNGRLAIIKNAGHFSFSEQPREFSKVVRRFLNELKQP